MSNSTEETWAVGSTVLNTYAYNIEQLTGREGIPPRRGENLVIPYAKGRLWMPKIEDERHLSLGMWVRDTDSAGVLPSTDQARRAQLRDNIETLKALFGVYSSLLSITRKIRLGSGLKTWTASAECVNTLDFTWDDAWPCVAKFVVELVMPDPYWYDSSTPKL